MSSKFVFEGSQFYAYNNGKIDGKSVSLGVLVKDIFSGSKGVVKYHSSLYYATGNDPLIDVGDSGDFTSVRAKLRLLFPEEFILDQSESVFRALTAHSGGNYSIGNKIINTFNGNPPAVLKKFDFICRQTLSEQSFTVDREGLGVYLKEIRSFIVPYELSPSANLKYGELLENKKLAVVLSRVLVSMVFALKPNSLGERVYAPSAETLNRIWCTPVVNVQSSKIQTNNVEEQCAYALSLFESGDYANSYILLKKLISSRYFEQLPETTMRHNVECAYAKHLLSGLECDAAPEEAVGFLVHAERNPEAKYLLSKYYGGLFTAEKNADLAARYLAQGAEMGARDALLELFEVSVAAQGGDLVGASSLRDRLFTLIQDMKIAEKGRFYYANGLLCELLGDREGAAKQFSLAAAAGNDSAIKKLSRKKRELPVRTVGFSRSSDKLCLINGNGKATEAFLRSLPGDYSVISVRACSYASIGVREVDGMDSTVSEAYLEELISGSSEKRLIAAFLGDDAEKNTDDGIELIDRLYNFALDLLNREEPEKARELIKRVEIFVGAEYDTASLLFDASIKDMCDNLYFKVRLCDKNRDAALELLHEYPLFIPFLKRSETSGQTASAVSVVLFGCSSLSERIAREACAVAYMGENYPISVTLVGEDAERVKNRFFQSAPGLYGNAANEKIKCLMPRFEACDLTSPDLHRLFAASGAEKTNSLGALLSSANYFVVDVGSDSENLKFAINLRRWLLKSTPSFDRKPFIAVHCEDSKTARLINHIPIQDQKQGNLWYNKFDIHCFGMNGSLYSFGSLIENRTLEERAEYIHLSYYGDKQLAYYDYHSSQYNKDSSLITAIALRYRLFVAGCYKSEDADGVFTAEKDAELAPLYTAWIKDKRSDNDERAAALEQSRWNGFMLSRGWEPASPEQIRNYLQQASGSTHKNMLAKLHPHICEWENLVENEHEIILNILKLKRSEVKNPQKATRENVENTENALTCR